MSTNTVDSLLALSSQSNTIELTETGQGETPRKKEEVGRLQRRVRTFKGNLTTAIAGFVSRITYYKTKYSVENLMCV